MVLSVERLREKEVCQGQGGLRGDGLLKLSLRDAVVLLAQRGLSGEEMELRSISTDGGHLLKGAIGEITSLRFAGGAAEDIEVSKIVGLRGPERFKSFSGTEVFGGKEAAEAEKEAGLGVRRGLREGAAELGDGGGVVCGMKVGKAEIEVDPGQIGVEMLRMLEDGEGFGPAFFAHEGDTEVGEGRSGGGVETSDIAEGSLRRGEIAGLEGGGTLCESIRRRRMLRVQGAQREEGEGSEQSAKRRDYMRARHCSMRWCVSGVGSAFESDSIEK